MVMEFKVLLICAFIVGIFAHIASSSVEIDDNPRDKQSTLIYYLKHCREPSIYKCNTVMFKRTCSCLKTSTLKKT